MERKNSGTNTNRLNNSGGYLSENFFYFFWICAFGVFLYIANPNLYYFLNDDFIHIPLAAKKSFLHGTLFRPLADISLWMDYQFWGKNAYGYHLTNVLIHIINSILVFFLARSIFLRFTLNKNSVLSKSIFASVLFLLYAFHSESIFWIIGRGGSLCCLFFLASFICFIKKGYYWYIGSLLFFLLGLFVYETIWIFPIIVTALYFFDPESRSLKKILGIWLLFSLYIIFRIKTIGSLPGGYELGAFYELNIYRLIYNLNTLFARCFLPPSDTKPLIILYVLLIILIGILCVLKKNKFFLVLILGIVVAILPALSLGIDTHDSESERFIYLATIFVVLVLIEAFSWLRKKLFIAGIFVVIVVHTFFLQKAASSYRYASLISKKSLECIGQLPERKIAAIDIPSQYKGALIFRIGFEAAAEWILDGNKDSVQVLSRKEIYKKVQSFECTTIDSLPLQDSRTYKLIKEVDKALVIWDMDSLKLIKVSFPS